MLCANGATCIYAPAPATGAGIGGLLDADPGLGLCTCLSDSVGLTSAPRRALFWLAVVLVEQHRDFGVDDSCPPLHLQSRAFLSSLSSSHLLPYDVLQFCMAVLAHRAGQSRRVRTCTSAPGKRRRTGEGRGTSVVFCAASFQQHEVSLTCSSWFLNCAAS